MPQDSPPAGRYRVIWRFIRIAAIVLLLLVVGGSVVLATHWPFTRQALTAALEEGSGRTVQIDTFTASYFPPGCTAEGLRFLRHKHPEAEPIITVQKLAIRGSLTGFFGSIKHLSTVRVVGMHMIIPPKPRDDSDHQVFLNAGPGGKSLAIDKITADGAVLEFIPEDRSPDHFVLKIDKLAVMDVGSGAPMSYRATLTNTVPPGVIHAEGKFGPWNPTDMGATPVFGDYTYNDIDLSHFKSVFGIGHARGQFSGPLSRIQTQGTVDVTGFRVDGSNHSIPLATTYEATVNGTNGDVLLNPATARYRHTSIEVRGWIAGREGEAGKTASFQIAVPNGRVDDLLLLFTKDQPGLTGEVTANGSVLWPPGPRKFLQKIRIDLVCGMSSNRFTNTDTQKTIDHISESASGEKKKEQNEDRLTVLSRFRGHIQVRDGTASLADGSFEVPGATADVHGTYNLLNQKVDLHGTLDTLGSIADATTGFKALVLKAVTPLFKRHDHTRIVPFRITGDYDTATVAIDWKKNFSR